MKLSIVFATVGVLGQALLAKATTSPDECYNIAYNFGFNSAYNDVWNKAIVDKEAGLYSPPVAGEFTGTLTLAAINDVCRVDNEHLTSFEAGFNTAFEAKVASSGKSVYDASYITCGGTIPVEPSAGFHRKRQNAMVKEIRRSHTDQW